MSYPAAMPDRRVQSGQLAPLISDLALAVLFIGVFAVIVYLHRYQNDLAESDLYRVLVGLMDGAWSGKELASNLHYDRVFGPGYLAVFYAFVDHATLTDPDRLAHLMNQVGFWCMLPTLLFFWCAVQLAHGSFVATIALMVFALGPMVPELATSGHQTIPMLGFLFAGATLLFLPAAGWKAVLAAVGGWALLLIGMTMRGELFLALPWVVLSRTDTRSLRAFIATGFVRSIAPGLALIGFLVLQHMLQAGLETAPTTTVSDYFRETYTWDTIPRGVVYMFVGCGIGTVAAAGLTCGYLVWATLLGRSAVALQDNGAPLLAPAALIVVPLLFFLANPLPTRHFIMPLAGMGILIGVALARWSTRRLVAVAVALAIGAANQVLAEAIRMPLVRLNEAHSSYLPLPSAYPTATHANLGWEWRRHDALLAKIDRWRAFGDTLRSSCDAHVLVLSDEVEQIFSRLYAGGTKVEANRIIIATKAGSPPLNPALRQDPDTVVIGEGASRLTGIIGKRGDKTFIMLEKSHLWPADAVAAVLATPALNEYKLIADPYTLSIYDKTAIPANRMVRLGCVDGSR